MDRLTTEDGICMDCDGIRACSTDCFYKQIYDKLKGYEDLGFAPEEIAYMAKFFKERTSAEYIANDMHIIARLLKAERKEAHWIPSQKCIVCTWDVTSYIEGYECSECGRFEEEKEPYCNCGCKMV